MYNVYVYIVYIYRYFISISLYLGFREGVKGELVVFFYEKRVKLGL